ncbi:MAG: hypothetical protein M1820_003160 [Bogoriella megaspora]|nr:MAG: hypothetical protein M1820_003160 [Bogoriella megaspora]
MFSFMQSRVPRTNTASQTTLKFEDGRSRIAFNAPGSHYLLTNVLPPGGTFCAPPLHIHMFQTEYFRVISGVGSFYLRPTASDSGQKMVTQGESITIPPRAYHNFENGSKTEDLVLELRLDPQRWEAEESFFRNFFGYLEDCRKAGKAPSLFQLMRFLYENDTALAIPMPRRLQETVGFWLNRGLVFVGGVIIGEWLLGYKGAYSEYYRRRTQ